MTKCNFLDIIIDLTNNSYTPYIKENSLTRYINFNSNHPTIIKKNLPKMIEKRLNRQLTDSQVFDNAKHSYQAALRQSNFSHELKYENISKTNYISKKKRKSNEKVIFFNPPYCQSVKTNIGKEFLPLIDKHFINENMKKIFNRNNCYVS